MSDKQSKIESAERVINIRYLNHTRGGARWGGGKTDRARESVLYGWLVHRLLYYITAYRCIMQ